MASDLAFWVDSISYLNIEILSFAEEANFVQRRWFFQNETIAIF